MKKSINGFTIVELLIVVVVIAILAAITIVSYQGIQTRALNAGIVNAASSYNKAIASYVVVKGTYPPTPSQATPGADDRICLGTGYVDHNGDSIPDCGNSGFPSLTYQPFNTAMNEIINIPRVSDVPLKTPYQNSTFTGVTLIRDDAFTVNGISNPFYLMYVLKGGNQDCGLSVVEENSGADPFPHTRPSSQKWSWSDGGTTMCVVALPNV